LYGIDVAIPEGNLVGIVGPNGAGKSTLIKAVMGVVRSTGGWVKVFGKPLKESLPRIGYVPQRESIDWEFPVTVMDDYSRFILAWELEPDMTATSLIDVVQKAVDFTCMADVPVEDRTALLSDNGAGYISRQFGEYLRLVGIRHIVASLYHPQTNGKIERYHRSIKGELSLVPFEMPGDLEEAIAAFIDYYNYRRYHEGLGDVTPYDIYTGKHLEII